RVGGHGGPAADRRGRQRAGAAVGADRPGWMDERAAGGATEEAQAAVGPRRPERLVLRSDPWQYAEGPLPLVSHSGAGITPAPLLADWAASVRAVESTVRLDVADDLATITFDRPPVNAIDRPTFPVLAETFESLRDRRDVRVAIFTATGSRAFVAGIDLKTFQPPAPTADPAPEDS